MLMSSTLNLLSQPGDGSPNDDRAGGLCGRDDGHAWVVDGATGVTDRIYIPSADSDAAWLAQQLDRHFASLPRGASPVRVPIRRILGRIRDDYLLATAGADAPDYAIPSAAGLFCGWERCGRRINLRMTGLGDCSALIRCAETGLHIIGDIQPGGGDAEMLSSFEAFHGARDPAAQKALWDFLKAQRSRMNRPGGYWVLSISPEAACHMREQTFSLIPPVDILLMTDGMARLIDHFDAYTPATLMDAACTLGLDALYRDLRAHEAEDADCQRAPRVKRADDASAVLVRIDRPDA